SLWRRTRARRDVWTGPPSYLRSIWVSASAPVLTLTRTALNAPFALLRSMLARPALASMARVASMTQRSPPVCALAANGRPVRQTYATDRHSIAPVGRPYLRVQDGSIPQDLNMATISQSLRANVA